MQADYIFHGARIRILAEGDLAESQARALLPGVREQSFEEPDSIFQLQSQKSLLSLEHDHHMLLPNHDPEFVRQFLLARLHESIAQHAKAHLIFRAGVVAWQGKAWVFPGPRLSGTTRLVEALCQRGAIRYSDRLAIFDDALNVLPYHGDALADQTSPGASVELVAWLPYQPGKPLHYSPQTAGQCALEMLRIIAGGQSLLPQAMAALSSICENAKIFKGTRADADSCAKALALELQRATGDA
ncbi:MAG: hypothetical protein KF760_02290 [Candidatus Eremiobacteraeota bacterium]|nr:hypothetical protein [Candidatus Eremiobacteraeota bacterium]MCW5868867.1 hypothetical protein [Candidatus Eremiobacteraeota bacterium]